LEHSLQYQPTPLSSDENQKQEKEAKQEDIDKIGDKKHINTHWNRVFSVDMAFLLLV